MFGSVFMHLKVVPTTCMEKNLLDREPYSSPLLNKQSILKNETFAFQVALKVDLYVVVVVGLVPFHRKLLPQR